jgi:hypothetical protein
VTVAAFDRGRTVPWVCFQRSCPRAAAHVTHLGITLMLPQTCDDDCDERHLSMQLGHKKFEPFAYAPVKRAPLIQMTG